MRNNGQTKIPLMGIRTSVIASSTVMSSRKNSSMKMATFRITTTTITTKGITVTIIAAGTILMTGVMMGIIVKIKTTEIISTVVTQLHHITETTTITKTYTLMIITVTIPTRILTTGPTGTTKILISRIINLTRTNTNRQILTGKDLILNIRGKIHIVKTVSINQDSRSM